MSPLVAVENKALNDIKVEEDKVIEQALDILERRMSKAVARLKNEPLASPKETSAFLKLKIAGLEREVFCVLFLDLKHRLIAFEELFKGTVHSASVFPREVVKRALFHNCSAVIISHNHPGSGDPEPSTADQNVTQRLKDALSLVDIRILDHIVVGAKDTVSFAERGLI